MSDAWGGASGSAATFDPAVVKQLLADLEKDLDALEKYYNSVTAETMQRREQHKINRQRAYDTSNRLQALLQLPARNSSASGERDRLLAQAQQVLGRFTDLQRRTIDIDGEIVSQMRKSLSTGTPSKDIILGNQVVLKSVDITQEMLRENNEGLAEATEKLRELDEIAKQMKALTEKQGEHIEVVEKKARDADVEVLVGVDEQKAASKYKCSSRWCKVIIIIIIIVIILALALGLGLGIGLKKKKN